MSQKQSTTGQITDATAIDTLLSSAMIHFEKTAAECASYVDGGKSWVERIKALQHEKLTRADELESLRSENIKLRKKIDQCKRSIEDLQKTKLLRQNQCHRLQQAEGALAEYNENRALLDA